jgi:serine/threonine protein kinase
MGSEPALGEGAGRTGRGEACVEGVRGVSMCGVNSEGEWREAAAQGPTSSACPSCGTRYPADALFCSLDGARLATVPSAIAVAAVTDPYLGREILGHIEVRQLVGMGAMGRVYRAFQRGIDRDVAVKVLHRELSSNPTIVARFHREAKVASRLSHPNVVHVLLVGQLPDGAMYIVMEYLDGMSLQSALAGGALPLPRALHMALQLCEAAGEAHAQGIVHRDLKPENVMLVHRADDPDFVKVLDFGIARLSWDEQAMTTAAGLIFGTARYISPEGAQGERVGATGDVYSIATIVYQMLAGRTPFDAEHAMALLVKQTRDVPPHLKAIPGAAYVPDPVAAVVMKNLAKKPEERASDARALGRALLDAAIAGGLRAQDVLARPALLDRGRGPHGTGVPSQRTARDTPERAVAPIEAVFGQGGERASNVPPSNVPPKTAYETPAPAETRALTRTELTPPGVETTPWTSEADVPAQVAAQPLGPGPAGRHSGAPLEASAGARPAGPETTINDQHPVPPLETLGASAASTTGTALAAGRSPSSVEITLAGETAIHGALRGQARPWVAAACVVMGALGVAAAVTWKAAPVVGGLADSDPLRAVVARAHRARAQQWWDSPPGDNVRDLTGDGLLRWPNNGELLGVRTLACDDIVRAARAKHDSGDVNQALDLARIAVRVDPSSRDANALVALWSREPEPPPAAATDSSVPPLAAAHPTPGVTFAAAPPVTSVRVALDASSVRPAVGQAVNFVARVLGAPRTKLDDPHFRVAGPGVATGTEVPAAVGDDTAVPRGTFTFVQAGRFEVSFSARVGVDPVFAVRSVVVSDPSRPPMLPPAAPPPAGTRGKWL